MVKDMRMWFERKYEKLACDALLKLIERASQRPKELFEGLSGTLTRWLELTRPVRSESLQQGPNRGIQQQNQAYAGMA